MPVGRACLGVPATCSQAFPHSLKQDRQPHGSLSVEELTRRELTH